MTVLNNALLLVIILALATAFGFYRKWADGRVSPADSEQALSESRLGFPIGSQATLLQFSSAFCQPCRATRFILNEVAESVPGVAHVEIDAESHLDLVREFSVTRTPTTFILDGTGQVIGKAVGLARKNDVLASLAPVLARSNSKDSE